MCTQNSLTSQVGLSQTFQPLIFMLREKNRESKIKNKPNILIPI